MLRSITTLDDLQSELKKGWFQIIEVYNMFTPAPSGDVRPQKENVMLKQFRWNYYDQRIIYAKTIPNKMFAKSAIDDMFAIAGLLGHDGCNFYVK